MTAKIGAGDITFSDNTTLNTASFAWSNMTGKPTKLSQFTNDLGNYGGFMTAANFTSGYSLNTGAITACGSRRGSIGHLTSGGWGLVWTGATGSTVTLQNYNCNCACNC